MHTKIYKTSYFYIFFLLVILFCSKIANVISFFYQQEKIKVFCSAGDCMYFSCFNKKYTRRVEKVKGRETFSLHSLYSSCWSSHHLPPPLHCRHRRATIIIFPFTVFFKSFFVPIGRINTRQALREADEGKKGSNLKLIGFPFSLSHTFYVLPIQF